MDEARRVSTVTLLLLFEYSMNIISRSRIQIGGDGAFAHTVCDNTIASAFVTSRGDFTHLSPSAKDRGISSRENMACVFRITRRRASSSIICESIVFFFVVPSFSTIVVFLQSMTEKMAIRHCFIRRRFVSLFFRKT
jgi:hypothetical protein